MIRALPEGAELNLETLMGASPMVTAGLIVVVVGLAAFAVAIFRLIRGPAPEDRIIAMDLATYVLTAILIAGAFLTGRGALLDIAVITGILSFVAASVFAGFLAKEGPT